MADFKFDFEWEDPAAAKGAELRATWARLSVSLGATSLTRLIDQDAKSVRTSVYVPLYPLAEWLVTNWWHLLYEIETPAKARAEYERRHNMRFAGEGFALPSIGFYPVGRMILVRWTPIIMGAQRIEFTASGSAYVPFNEFRSTITDFVQAVRKRLDNDQAGPTFLDEEWEAITAMPPEEEDFCRAAASLGLDPFAVDNEQRDMIIHAASSLPNSILEDFFTCAAVSHLTQDLDTLRKALVRSSRNDVDLPPLRALRDEILNVRVPAAPPWEQGYAYARLVRQVLQLDGMRLSSTETLSRALRVRDTDLKAAILQESTAVFDALVATNRAAGPSFVIRERPAARVRFAFCRALFEYLTAPNAEPRLVTSAHSDIQKRNRAFAAEFLLPATVLREAVRRETLTDDDVGEIAETFGVSDYVVRHQLYNHEIARAESAAIDNRM